MPDAGRVIAGSARGARLAAPGSGTRPLGDRAKQAVFAILEPRIVDSRVLDLFAGSGAAGIEALSRGAGHAVFVERSRRACEVIARNCVTARIDATRRHIACTEVLEYLASAARATTDGPFDLVMVDPPYADVAARLATLELLGAPGAGWLTEDAVVVVTHDRHHEVPATAGLLASGRRKRFGETVLTIYERRAGQGGG